MNYHRALKKADKDRQLYLSIIEDVYRTFFLKSDVQEALSDFGMSLLVINPDTEELVMWINFPTHS